MCTQEAINELQKKIEENEVFMLTNNHCPYCSKALLKIKTQLKVPEPYLLNLDKISQDQYMRYAPCFAQNQVITVPKIFYQGKFIGGYGELEHFIGSQKTA